MAKKPDESSRLLTDVNGKDTAKAMADLEAHKLPVLFSYRQAYFVGAKAQDTLTRQATIREVGEQLVNQECPICEGCGELDEAVQAWDIPDAPIPECSFCKGTGKVVLMYGEKPEEVK